MAPPSNPDDQSFRFMNLPPEIRNSIYDFAFEDDAPEVINIFEARQKSPPFALTAVSSQVRAETLELFRQASCKFWSKHNFQVQVGIHIVTKGETTEQVFAECVALKLPVMQRLRFQIASKPGGGGLTFAMDVTKVVGSRMATVWESRWSFPSIIVPASTAEARNSTCVHDGGLDLEGCVRMFCRIVHRSQDDMASVFRLRHLL